MTRFKVFWVVVAWLFIVVGCGTETRGDGGFVKVVDGQFTVGNDRYIFVGTNLWFGAYLGADTGYGHRHRLRRELDLLKMHGVTNLRVLGASEASPLRDAVTPTFQDQTRAYNEELLVGLDYLLAEMAKRDMKAVIYLNNFWEWSGGMATYLYWSTGGIVDPSDPSKPWPAFAKFTAQFYADQAANDQFRSYIRHVVTRTNTVTGVRYADDPTIMSWQLANEPRPGFADDESREALPGFYNWVDETAAFIKSLDHNHLVSTGNEGFIGCIQYEPCVTEMNSSVHIDYMTFHMWPKNWGWIDTTNMPETFDRVIMNADAYIEQHVAVANRLRKPLVLEEFGLERDDGGVGPSHSTQHRDLFFRFIFDEVEQSVSEHGPFVGTNFWAWGGYGRAMHEDSRWRDGDTAYTGDPPQEPQGLNSVFDTDLSTLQLIAEHAQALEAAD